MKLKNIKTIKLKIVEWGRTTNMDMIEIEAFDEFKKEADRISTVNIEDGKKVFFRRGVTYPRTKFSKVYPKNIAVVDIKDADMVILTNEDLRDITISHDADYGDIYEEYGFDDYFECTNGRWTHDETSRCRVPGGQTRRLAQSDHYCYKVADEFLNKYKHKQVVNVNTLKMTNSEEVITDETYERLEKMLSGDNSMIDMAYRTFIGFDYEKSKYRLLALTRIRSVNKTNVEIKTLMNKLRGEDLNYYYNQSYESWIRLLSKTNDGFLQRKFSEFVNNEMGIKVNITVTKE